MYRFIQNESIEDITGHASRIRRDLAHPGSSEPEDRDLEQRVKNFLLARQQPVFRSLGVQASGGIVTLRGQVRTFYQKQLCLHGCQRVAGVRQVVDDLQVDDILHTATKAGHD